MHRRSRGGKGRPLLRRKHSPAADDTAYDVLAVTACPHGHCPYVYGGGSAGKGGTGYGHPPEGRDQWLRRRTERADGRRDRAGAGHSHRGGQERGHGPVRGKRLISVPVADGIKRPEALLRQTMAPDAPVYQAAEEAPSSPVDQPAKAGKPGLGHALYQHLMNGVSHMLPFVVAGGIFIALAF